MKRIMKITLILFCFTMGFMGITTQAEAKAYMNDSYIKFGIKAKKKFSYYNYFDGIGSKKQTAQITSYSVKKHPSKSGYKVATINVTFYDDYIPSKSQIHKICNTGNEDFGDMFNTYIMDYATGKVLSNSYEQYDPEEYYDFEEFYDDELYGDYDSDVNKWVDTFYTKDNQKITTTYYRWTYGKSRRYKAKDYDGCWIELASAKRKIKVEFPANYKNLVIGLGGSSKLYETYNDMKFDTGMIPFKKTSYYSKKRTYWKFMRIK